MLQFPLVHLQIPTVLNLSDRFYDLKVLHYVKWYKISPKSFTNTVVTFSQTLYKVFLDQRDAHLLYFTIYLLHSSTCFEHYMLIIRRLNCVDAASQSVAVWCTGWERTAEQSSPNLCTGRPLTERTIPDAATISSTSWWWEYDARNM